MASPMSPVLGNLVRRASEGVMMVFGSRAANLRDRDNSYEIIKDLKMQLEGSGNYGLAIVRRRRDGKLAMRKKLKLDEYKELTAERAIKNFDKLSHPNVIHFIDGYKAGLDARVYTEICDLGDLKYFRARDTAKRRFPGAFYWHVAISLVQGICYLAYGYNSFEEVLENEGERPGWDSIIHTDLNTENVFVQSASHDSYPKIKLADFDACRLRADYQREFPPTDDPMFAWSVAQNYDLRATIGIINEILPDPKAELRPEIAPLEKLVSKWYSIKRNQLDAREMAKSLKEAMETGHINFNEPFPKELLEPHDLFKSALTAGKGKDRPWLKVLGKTGDKRKREEEGDATQRKHKSSDDAGETSYNESQFETASDVTSRSLRHVPKRARRLRD